MVNFTVKSSCVANYFVTIIIVTMLLFLCL